MTASIAGASPIRRVLDLARWAPSGDNTQPWRFEIVDESHVVVHGFDTRHDCVYDLDGSASQIAIGGLIETMAIAASGEGLAVEVEHRPQSPIARPVFDVHFVKQSSMPVDPLRACIETRSVQRRPLRTRPLTASEKGRLEAAVGPRHHLSWKEGASNRWRMASLLFASAKLRLTMPEAYAVHARVIEWSARFSEDRVPEAAVGMDALSARLMRWAMRSWPRVSFFNRFLAGTWLPRIQLDVLPALACAAHFFLIAEKPARSIHDFVAAGRAMQRLWLTATSIGLQLQPEVTPLIFARYARDRVHFSDEPGMDSRAAGIAKRLAAAIGEVGCDRAVFIGRVGDGRAATARSIRLPLDRLMVDPNA